MNYKNYLAGAPFEGGTTMHKGVGFFSGIDPVGQLNQSRNSQKEEEEKEIPLNNIAHHQKGRRKKKSLQNEWATPLGLSFSLFILFLFFF